MLSIKFFMAKIMTMTMTVVVIISKKTNIVGILNDN